MESGLRAGVKDGIYPVGRQKLRGAVALFRKRGGTEMWALIFFLPFLSHDRKSVEGYVGVGRSREGLFWISGA